MLRARQLIAPDAPLSHHRHQLKVAREEVRRVVVVPISDNHQLPLVAPPNARENVNVLSRSIAKGYAVRVCRQHAMNVLKNLR